MVPGVVDDGVVGDDEVDDAGGGLPEEGVEGVGAVVVLHLGQHRRVAHLHGPLEIKGPGYFSSFTASVATLDDKFGPAASSVPCAWTSGFIRPTNHLLRWSKSMIK